MRYYEISSGFRLPVSKEEREFITKFGQKPVSLSDLDERQAQVAHDMAVKGVLKRTDTDDGTFYEPDQMDLWRF